MRSAILVGRDHTTIGAIELVAEGPCAVAISRGGAPKTYSHTEPNEDACMFSIGLGGVLIAVADGHRGAIGSEIAMRQLLDRYADRWTSSDARSALQLEQEAVDAVSAMNLAILNEAERCGLPPSPTTLCFALVRPNDDLLIHASTGDSHIFRTRESAPVDLAWAAQSDGPPFYLGYPPTPEREAGRRVGCEPLVGTRSIVLVTDGFSEVGIGYDDPETELHAIQSRTLLAARELRAIETCRGVALSANKIQRRHRAGDNVACAVWLASE